jgi:hypothetical protein
MSADISPVILSLATSDKCQLLTAASKRTPSWPGRRICGYQQFTFARAKCAKFVQVKIGGRSPTCLTTYSSETAMLGPLHPEP